MSRRKITAALALTAAFICAAAFGTTIALAAPNSPRTTMPAFRSDAELIDYLKRLKRVQDRRAKAAAPSPMPAPPPMTTAAPAAADSAAAEGPAQGITNTQEAGVDEGGIVKMRGDMLVILRRGRLFTVSTAGGDLRPIDSINAFPPGVDPRSDWYDEMLIAGDRVIVIGYSYGRGGTEINRFRLDRDGRLRFEDAYHLKSNDYYSSRNYASRLIGTRLIVYSPLYLPYGNVADSFEWMPGVRRWTGDPKAGFERIVSARQIYLPRPWENPEEADADALHTVTNCDLAAPVLYCNATAVLGPSGRNFYVSANAVYVWVSQGWWGRKVDGRRAQSMLYRMPLDGSAPSAIGVRGTPTDQFSFSEDWRSGVINVLVRGSGGGDAMFSPEFANGRVSLLRLPLTQFGGGGDEAARSYYRRLPSAPEYGFQNRFVGDYVLYGTGAGWGSQRGGSVLVAASVRGYGVTEIPLPHGVDRIEAMGRDAVVVGGDGRDLFFRAVELTSGWTPQLGDVYRLEGAAQGETRSHAFFFKPEPRDDETAGVMALPVVRGNRPGYRQLTEGSAAILFLRRSDRKFAPLGELEANGESVRDDGCQASCVDWYGNARPIFLPRRTFALMGYEIVEGELGPQSIRETRRVSFAPGRW